MTAATFAAPAVRRRKRPTASVRRSPTCLRSAGHCGGRATRSLESRRRRTGAAHAPARTAREGGDAVRASASTPRPPTSAARPPHRAPGRSAAPPRQRRRTQCRRRQPESARGVQGAPQDAGQAQSCARSACRMETLIAAQDVVPSAAGHAVADDRQGVEQLRLIDARVAARVRGRDQMRQAAHTPEPGWAGGTRYACCAWARAATGSGSTAAKLPAKLRCGCHAQCHLCGRAGPWLARPAPPQSAAGSRRRAPHLLYAAASVRSDRWRARATSLAMSIRRPRYSRISWA